MILTHVTIVVKDQTAALEFYTKNGFREEGRLTESWPAALADGWPERAGDRDGLVAGGLNVGSAVAYKS
jgi:catechol 2,3-dioxygenase-like lactoylglutathione lyase family enzyme